MDDKRRRNRYNCLPTETKPCDNWILENRNPIGEESMHGNVYLACRDLKKKNCFYALKIVRGNDETSRVVHEVEMQNLCSSKGYCMPVVDWWIYEDPKSSRNDFGVIITSLLSESVHNRLIRYIHDSDYTWDIIKKSLELIYNIHQSGIWHGDAHLRNIMFTSDGEMKFIDLDTANLYSDVLESKSSVETIKESITEDYYTFTDDGLSLVIHKTKKNAVDSMKIFYQKLFIILSKEMVMNIANEERKKNENNFDFLKRLRDIEYRTLSKILGLSFEDILNYQISEDGIAPLPVNKYPELKPPSPIHFEKKREYSRNPVSIEIISEPKGSVAELIEEEPEIIWSGGTTNLMEGIGGFGGFGNF